MFKQLFTKRTMAPVKAAISGISTKELVEKIHKEFFTSSEVRLKEAKAIIETYSGESFQKAQQLKTLGFTSMKPVTEAEIKLQEKDTAKIESDHIVAMHALSADRYKFIDYQSVQKILNKYNLSVGRSSDYIGDIPDNKVTEIQAFVEWKKGKSSIGYESYYCIDRIRLRDTSEGKDKKHLKKIYEAIEKDEAKGNLNARGTIIITRELLGSYAYNFKEYVSKKVDKEVASNIYDVDTCTRQGEFFICAPEKDFKVNENATKVAQYTPDPVVLWPVKNGFLIVAAWGPEASDPIVVNHTQN